MKYYPRETAVCAFLALAVMLVYLQVCTFGFVAIDDIAYVKDNYSIKQGITLKSISWAFTSLYAANWHPVTWLSHMADIDLFGMDPGMHHLTNVVLHLSNSILLFLFLRFSTGEVWKSAVVASLFSLHPLHVESVAWISERKDVLSTLFWMLTMLFYSRYARGPSLKRYLLMAACFATGLMAKPMLVTLPFVLLLLDYWPLKRTAWNHDASYMADAGQRTYRHGILYLIGEKTPLFAMAGISCLITFVAQKAGGAVNTLDSVPMALRAVNSLTSYAGYLVKTLWPVHLAVFYPLSRSISPGLAAGASVLLILVSCMAVLALKKYPYLAVGWFWYLGTLVPVIGLVQVGAQAMADRYTYIPLVGIFIMAVWGVSDLSGPWRHRRIMLAGLSSAVLIAMISLTWFQVRTWKDSLTLFSHAIAITKNNYLAHHNLGCALFEKGRVQEAIDHYNASLKVYPNYGLAHSNLAVALQSKGDYKDAFDHYYLALKNNPKSAQSRYNIANGLSFFNRTDDAIREYRAALELNPHHADAWNNLGKCLMSEGRTDEAISCYARSLEINPKSIPARLNLSRAFESRGRIRDAAAQIDIALKKNPGSQELRKRRAELARKEAFSSDK